MVKFEKGSLEFEFMREYYILMQEFWDANDSEEFWDIYLKRSNELYKKYDNSMFAKSLILALSDELGRKANAGRVR